MRPFALALAGALIGCGGSKGDTASPATGTTPSTGTTTGSATGSSGTTLRTATLQGRIALCDGSPLADAQIRFCDPQVCRYQSSGADGSYSYPETLYGWNSFEVIPAEGSGLPTGFVPLLLADGQTRSVDLTLCPHDPWTPIPSTPTEVAHGQGLWITVAADLLDKPTPLNPDLTQTAGLLLDPAHWVPTDEITGTVVAQWFVDPYNYKAVDPDGLDYRIDGATLGLAATTYRAYVGSYDDFAWLDLGTLSDADADGWYTPDAQGLPLLGTLVLVEE